MKTIFTGLLLGLYIFSFSQNAENVVDSCFKGKLLPCKSAIFQEIVEIDTIEGLRFTILIEELYNKMQAPQILSVEEDRILVLLMNTIIWAELDNQRGIQGSYPKLKFIADFFDTEYQKVLYCKYTVCTGRGLSVYFNELKVQYMGNPFACDRFFVK